MLFSLAKTLSRGLGKTLSKGGALASSARSALSKSAFPRAQVLGGLAGRRLRGSSEIKRGLQQAIQARVLVRFSYSDAGEPRFRAFRTASPHALWSEGGKVYLHAYLNPGSPSRSRSSPPWRTFILSKVQDLELMPKNQTESQPEGTRFSLAPGWRPGWYSRQGRAPVSLVKP
jgi:predicted DNA-binding transcriptional regulator YafY